MANPQLTGFNVVGYTNIPNTLLWGFNIVGYSGLTEMPDGDPPPLYVYRVILGSNGRIITDSNGKLVGAKVVDS